MEQYMTVSDLTIKRGSSYLQYLPGIFREDVFIGQFLLIFESTMKPVEYIIGNITDYLDPSIAPRPFLEWLASWLNLSLDRTWPEDRCRELVKSAAELYRWRGTKWGLSEYIRIYTGVEPEIYESTPGMILDQNNQLGSGMHLGNNEGQCHFTVVMSVDKDMKIDDTKIRIIIESQKPAYSTYSLQIKPKGD
jgi:phage tail-like protein